ncbi:MAG: hypothetical protein PHX61_00670 [Alphaproteobacteria bacterium]|nr:hypothetical protein [Alphaproteobacteria bacterium]
MKEKILALLIAAFSGVRKDGLNQLARTIALQAATEEDAKTLVEKLTKAQVDEFVKEYRAEVDKEVSDGNKTFETNLKKKFDLVEKKTNEPGDGGKDPKGGDPNDIAALVKAAVADAVSPLQAKLESYEKGDIAKSRLQTLNEKLSTCKDENFKTQALKDFGRMNFNSDDEFNEYLTEKETAIATANQNVADATLGGQGKPLFTQKAESGISQGVAEYVASQKPDANVLSGKEV